MFCLLIQFISAGKILENLDALAGSIAYLHCEDGRNDTPPLTIVTASVDSIDMTRSVPPDADLKLSGFVSHVGSSSMEISMKVETVPDGEIILSALFTMVARNPVTYKAESVNRLVVESAEEKEIFNAAAERKESKQVARQMELTKRPPSVEEMYLIHNMYLSNRSIDASHLPDDVVCMKDAKQQSLVMCMPQDRNIHNNIFGGYLMRLAFELAYSTAMMYTRSPRVSLVAMDDVLFRRPVPIGSLLSLTAQVVYSSPEDDTFQLRVRADVVDPIEDLRETTNTFSFGFYAPDGAIRKVVPQSYEESMLYLEGRRASQKMVARRKDTVGDIV
ncbi:Acyl-coenzyme A thioesterase 9, mitochondrial [Rhizophlyctis rosea]|uniref:Acyl-coenzyme A thioesterase 9, mitochondrial n=1 Tax=Rhizophlyctis rosea TaxID=64517 RepID=A0AAD5SBP6_9FUNG|nr:Acyl-coenzyme A thioesterase 9, mitochondrial [Rhizophlyctis rosea]